MDGMTRRGTRELVGARIRAVREARGLSVRELGGLSDVPELMLAAIERGRMRITFENLLCLARALGVPAIDLFDFEKDGRGESRGPGMRFGES
ncbi:MAG: helix-turn-helix domain-containing protein [Planctomycetota bacterium]|jgi:transcriptional regulator with XRE-family HTH domain